MYDGFRYSETSFNIISQWKDFKQPQEAEAQLIYNHYHTKWQLGFYCLIDSP